MNTPENDAGHALGAGFPRVTREQWRAVVAEVLGKSGREVDPDDPRPEDALARTTYDGITVSPLYDSDDDIDSGFPGAAPFTRGTGPRRAGDGGWEIRQRTDEPDPAAARRAIRADLDNGAAAVWLAAGGTALPPEAIGEALAGTDPVATPVVLDPGPAYPEAARALLAAHDNQGADRALVPGHLGIDPITVTARTGAPAKVADAARLAAEYADQYPRLGLVIVDATPYHDAGGSHAQELGASMAAGVAYLRALTEAGMGLAEAARRLEFRYAADADQFSTIAKLRAARSMWNRVTEACGLEAAHRGMRQHAVTSAAMLTRRDPHVNILRGTLACVGAGLGGADAVTVRPFDTALGLPDGSARRIARNTQNLLVQESELARVADPAGGSFYVERLTADLHTAGWAFFQELEAAGGMMEALTSGLLAERVDEVWQRRRANLAHRADPVTGVSEFPALDEPEFERRPRPSGDVPPERSAALPRRRYAQEFEELRDRADAHLADTGSRPRVFLATLGPVAAHTPRATFTANLLRAGGIEPVGGDTTEGAQQAAAAFADSGADVACLCSSDRVYAERAADAVAALREAGARRVLLAGAPEHNEASGADTFLFAGCDAISLLTELHDTLGVAP
ncbi:heterodimeric methylmalonyl-CoA mutase small subunit [Haloactinospora alba]|uniref:methylmalonyl-CoA mutase n=1 Tax=Haloactinospora alba TaxID=405555 RepID=A0A543N6R0_9ACTN|nr:methylmalonyl-CoA mutase family protein [Haloactinospora alba]TQN27516.1 heterodimeric methylmalonyl-CoA mutase small subunit [Haloactinospora alba]